MNRITFDNEDEIRIKSLAGALAINGLLIALLFLISLSQTVPNPPPIQFVEVNFGTDARGSGRIQTYNKASDSPNPVDVKSADKRPNRTVGPPKVTPTPRVEKTRVTPSPKVENAKPSRTPTEKPIIASKTESPVTTPERPEPRRVETPKATAPAERPAPPAPAKKVETVNNEALFKKSPGGGGSGGGANGTVGKASGTGGNNNGDDASGVGDKGNPNGKINAKEFYGTPGGASSGVAFDVSGWSMASRPSVNDESDETGKIVFRITVDGEGEITRIQQLQSTVSPSVSRGVSESCSAASFTPQRRGNPAHGNRYHYVYYKGQGLMQYAEAIDYLYSRLPVFHRIGPKALKPGLGNTLLLCEALGNPQHRFASIHVAGTNGKGSTSHMLASVYQSAGYRVGLYTSPHLKSFTERIRLNGQPIPEPDVARFVLQHQALIERIEPSFFEVTVAMAFDFFARAAVDMAIIEVGLGGRLDSTNVITPVASIITNIGYDHTDILGETLPQIAGEKAGIIKAGVPVFIGETHPETRGISFGGRLGTGSHYLCRPALYYGRPGYRSGQRRVAALGNG